MKQAVALLLHTSGLLYKKLLKLEEGCSLPIVKGVTESDIGKRIGLPTIEEVTGFC